MDYSNKTIRLRQLLKESDNIRYRIWEEAKKVFNVGDTVFFEKWGREITAEILDMSGPNYPRFFVRSHTGKKYWIDLYYLLNT